MSWGTMATGLRLSWCRGIRPTGHYCPEGHDLSGTTTPDGVIHFADRPHTRANTLAFLRLAARLIDPTLDAEDVPWRRVYRHYLLVRECARELHIPNPAYPARHDRAFVLAGVAGVSDSVPLRKRAYDWARRGPKRKA